MIAFCRYFLCHREKWNVFKKRIRLFPVDTPFPSGKSIKLDSRMLSTDMLKLKSKLFTIGSEKIKDKSNVKVISII